MSSILPLLSISNTTVSVLATHTVVDGVQGVIVSKLPQRLMVCLPRARALYVSWIDAAPAFRALAVRRIETTHNAETNTKTTLVRRETRMAPLRM